MKIGNINLESNIFLAPLAGVTDIAFRLVCQEFGAELTFTEMVSAKGLDYGDESTKRVAAIDPREKCVGLQIFGSDPDVLERVIVEQLNLREDFRILDFNMGCPAPKIVKNGDGSALLLKPRLVSQILQRMVAVSNKPVTVKYRSGFGAEKNFIEIGKIAEAAGVSALTLHARTREQYYRGRADWKDIAELKKKVKIPVFGSGDVRTPEDVESLLETTGADGVCVARGAMGNPFLFRQWKQYKENGFYEKETLREIVETVKKQYALVTQLKSSRRAVQEMRKHIAWYLKGIPHAGSIKNFINTCSDATKVIDVLEEFALGSESK